MNISKSQLSTMKFDFLYVDNYMFGKDWIYLENYIPYSIVRYIVEGRAVFQIDGKEHVVEENQIAYIHEGAYLACHSLTEKLQFISIRFSVLAHVNGNDFLTEIFHLPPVTNAGDSTIYNCFEEIYKNAVGKNISRFFKIRGNLELIVAYLVDSRSGEMQEEGREPERKGEERDIHYLKQREEHLINRNINRDSRIQAVVEYLMLHPEENFSSLYLSDMAGLSTSSFRRCFKKHTGKTPGDFIRELKLSNAARRLLVTNESIANIAYSVGFNDQNYFTHVFREAFGVSPSHYRKISRE